MKTVRLRKLKTKTNNNNKSREQTNKNHKKKQTKPKTSIPETISLLGSALVIPLQSTLWTVTGGALTGCPKSKPWFEWRRLLTISLRMETQKRFRPSPSGQWGQGQDRDGIGTGQGWDSAICDHLCDNASLGRWWKGTCHGKIKKQILFCYSKSLQLSISLCLMT